MKINYIKIIKWILIIVLDCLVYIAIGLILITYEDHYDESKGEYWSLDSMTIVQKGAFILYYVWLLLNFLFIIKIIWSVFKRIKENDSL